jgi:hypothetical protein
VMGDVESSEAARAVTKAPATVMGCLQLPPSRKGLPLLKPSPSQRR